MLPKSIITNFYHIATLLRWLISLKLQKINVIKTMEEGLCHEKGVFVVMSPQRTVTGLCSSQCCCSVFASFGSMIYFFIFFSYHHYQS